MKRFLLGLAIILFLTTFIISFGFPQKNVPLPQEFEIIPPPPDIPPEIAAFSGRWEGIWEGELESILIVEEIDNQKAKIIYAWGDAPRWRIDKNYLRLVVKVIPGSRPKIEWGGGEWPKFSFEMQIDLKSIKGIREFRGSYSKITMKRAER